MAGTFSAAASPRARRAAWIFSIASWGRRRPGASPPPGNFRPPRAAAQIVAPDGSAYTVLLVPRRPSIFGVLSLPGISLTILAIALIVSAFASWWLAQHLSAPIRRIQEGARALADRESRGARQRGLGRPQG